MASLTRTKMELVREAWKTMSPQEIHRELSPRLGPDATLEQRESLFDNLMKSPMLSDQSLADKVLEAVFMTPDTPFHPSTDPTPVSSFHSPDLDRLGAGFQRLGAEVRPILEEAIKWESSMGSERRAVWANPLKQSLEVVKAAFSDAEATLRRFGGGCGCAVCEGTTRARTETQNLITGCQGMLEGTIYVDVDVKDLADRHAERQTRARPGRLSWITPPSRATPSLPKIHNFNGIPGIVPKPSPKPSQRQEFRRLMDDPPDDNFDPRWPCNHREYEPACPACERAVGKKNETARELEGARRREKDTAAKLKRANDELYRTRVEQEHKDSQTRELEATRKRVEKERKELEEAKRKRAELASELESTRKELSGARWDLNKSEMAQRRMDKRERDRAKRRAEELEAAEKETKRRAEEKRARAEERRDVDRQLKETKAKWKAACADTDVAIKWHTLALEHFDEDAKRLGWREALRQQDELRQTRTDKKAAEARLKVAVERLRVRLATLKSS